jgi:hypothetical protein
MAEFMRLHLALRADSLLGLIRMAPSLAGGDQLALLGITLRAFEPARNPVVLAGGH